MKTLNRVLPFIQGTLQNLSRSVALTAAFTALGPDVQAQEAGAPFGHIDVDAMAQYATVASDDPVVAVNLFKFKSREKAAEFLKRTGEVTLPHIEKIGGRVLYGGTVAGEFSQAKEWDMVFLVQYPSYNAIYQTVSDKEFGPRVLRLRDDTLEAAQFLITVPRNPSK